MIAIILLVNIAFISAIGGSMGNAKMILRPEVNGFTTTTIEKSILTRNTNDIPINIRLEIGEGEDFLELLDEEYTLEPGEEKDAEFLINVRKEGTYNGKINVFFAPIEGKEPGVVLASTIIVIAKKDQGYEEIEEDETEESNEEIEDEDGVSVSFGGNAPENPNSQSESSISFSLKGVMLGISLILVVVLVGLSYVMVKKVNKKTKRKKRRVKKSGGKKKIRRKKKWRKIFS